MIKNKIILVPLLTSFIVFSFLISLAYAISINSNRANKLIINNKSFYYDRNCLIFISILLIIMLIIFNIYMVFHRYEKSHKLIV